MARSDSILPGSISVSHLKRRLVSISMRSAKNVTRIALLLSCFLVGTSGCAIVQIPSYRLEECAAESYVSPPMVLPTFPMPGCFAKWKAENKKFDGATVTKVEESKTILGYECKKAILKLVDGNTFTLYYANNITPSVKEFEYQFKDIPGFVLEYESQEQNGKKVKYTAIKINLSPVQASRFEIPTSGYRILN